MKRYLDVMKSEIRKFKEFQKWFDKYIKKNYGKKCPEFNWHCHSCHAFFTLTSRLNLDVCKIISAS